MRVLVILGSARGESHTEALVNAVIGDHQATRIDLRALEIQQYEYQTPMERDEFAAVAEAMVAHDVIVLATPVYWYSMSGRMKVMFDRLTDLVTVRKDLGRRLKGRRMFVIACGSDSALPDGFERPFAATAAYLGMQYDGVFYAQSDKNGLKPSAITEANQFGDRIWATAC